MVGRLIRPQPGDIDRKPTPRLVTQAEAFVGRAGRGHDAPRKARLSPATWPARSSDAARKTFTPAGWRAHGRLQPDDARPAAGYAHTYNPRNQTAGVHGPDLAGKQVDERTGSPPSPVPRRTGKKRFGGVAAAGISRLWTKAS